MMVKSLHNCILGPGSHIGGNMSEGSIREFWGDESSDEQFPSGYTRKDNYDFGFTEFWEGEIVCFGTRQTITPP